MINNWFDWVEKRLSSKTPKQFSGVGSLYAYQLWDAGHIILFYINTDEEISFTIALCIRSYSRSPLAYVGGLMQDCSISIANALEILQPCTA